MPPAKVVDWAFNVTHVGTQGWVRAGRGRHHAPRGLYRHGLPIGLWSWRDFYGCQSLVDQFGSEHETLGRSREVLPSHETGVSFTSQEHPDEFKHASNAETNYREPPRGIAPRH